MKNVGRLLLVALVGVVVVSLALPGASEAARAAVNKVKNSGYEVSEEDHWFI